MDNALSKFSAAELRDALISVTIGSGVEVNFDKANDLFTEYIKRALPGIQVLEVELFHTAAALNSIAGTVRMKREGKEEKVFAKIHVESGTKSISAVGVEGEYRNARLLQDAGWPVLAPLETGNDLNFPLLMYPKISASTLFQLLEQSYKNTNIMITGEDLIAMEECNRQIGDATQKSLSLSERQNATTAPVQNLFLRRFEKGGRIDQWHSQDTEFRLPGLLKPLSWGDLLHTQWIINGKKFTTSIAEVIARARKSLAFEGEDMAAVAVSHGDDHAGNVFIDRGSRKARVFDPAFAGHNPISLCDLKAFAHTGFLPMAGLYYDPKLEICRYQWDQGRNIISVDISFQATPVYKVHETIARQILNERILPLYRKARTEFGIDMTSEKERLTSGLFGCALLTNNLPMLLEKDDGRGKGLLPLAIMFAELRGLPVLEELDRELKNMPA